MPKIVSLIIIIGLCIWWGNSCSSNSVKDTSSRNKSNIQWMCDYKGESRNGEPAKEYRLHVVFLEKSDERISIACYDDDSVKIFETTLGRDGEEPGFKWFGKFMDKDGNWGWTRLNEVFSDGRWKLVGDFSNGRISDEWDHPVVISQR